jgi:hypothetical protein
MKHHTNQKAVNFFGFFRLCIPSQWQCHLEENGSYGCYEENVESGTLWIRHFAWRFPGRLTEPHLSNFIQSNLIPRLNAMGIQDTLSEEVYDLPDGDAISEVAFYEKDPNDGINLRSRRWYFIRSLPDKVLIVSATLVLPDAIADDEEFMHLVDVMRDNIESATILHTNIEFEDMN